jgi:predicted nucleotidyltransferase component of viral defense system
VDINPFSLRVLKSEEMVAEKIHSLLARKKARDLYDLFFLLRISGFNKKLVEKKLEIFGMKFSQIKFNAAINDTKSIWKHELKSFVLEELPDFKTVKKFVIERVKS